MALDEKPPELAELLEKLDSLQPPPGARMRVLRRIEGPTSRPVRRFKPRVWVMATAIFFGAAISAAAVQWVADRVMDGSSEEVEPLEVLTPSIPSQPKGITVRPAVSEEPEPAASIAPTLTETVPKPFLDAGTASTELEREVRAYEFAMALRDRNPEGALRAFRTMKDRWPNGALTTEVNIRIAEIEAKLASEAGTSP